MTDRNGFTVDDLFVTHRPIRIGEKQLWMRVLGDVDETERAEWIAGEETRTLIDLNDETSLLYHNHVSTLEKLTKDELAETLVAAYSPTLLQQAMEGVEVKPLPEALPMSTPVEQAAMRLEHQQAQKDIGDERSKYFNALVAAYRDDQQKKTLEVLKEEAVNARKNLKLLDVRMRAWVVYTIYASLYQDEYFHTRYFNGPAAAYQLPAPIKNRLMQKYDELDKFSQDYALTIDFLEKSPSGLGYSVSSKKAAVTTTIPGRKRG